MAGSIVAFFILPFAHMTLDFAYAKTNAKYNGRRVTFNSTLHSIIFALCFAAAPLNPTSTLSALSVLLQLSERLQVAGASGVTGWVPEPAALAFSGITALYEAMCV